MFFANSESDSTMIGCAEIYELIKTAISNPQILNPNGKFDFLAKIII